MSSHQDTHIFRTRVCIRQGTPLIPRRQYHGVVLRSRVRGAPARPISLVKHRCQSRTYELTLASGMPTKRSLLRGLGIHKGDGEYE